MTLGEKLRQARLDAGLSQRQLSEPQITRNMLSRIEHGAVQPSMATMQFLARRLGKPVSFFLEEETEQPAIRDDQTTRLHRSFQNKDYASVAAQLEQLPEPTWEQSLLLCLSVMNLARQAIDRGQLPLARNLLKKASDAAGSNPYTVQLDRELILLRYQAGENPGRLAAQLPEDDRELMLRARAAQDSGDSDRAMALLTAAGKQDSALWNLLQGEKLFAAGEYAPAAECFRRAETDYPRKCYPRLETCYRELEDYKQAYFYACKQRK